MLENIEMRAVYCEEMMKYAAANKDIVLLDADLATASGTLPFIKALPDQHVNVGIAEANMVGVAAGLATCGKIPFAHTFAPFATRRCFDQFTVSVAYAKIKVVIVGSDPGITAEANGGTHMPLEDMSLVRTLPNVLCVEPTDSTHFKAILPQIIEYPHPVYIRLLRKHAHEVFANRKDADFTLGKANLLEEGKDITLFCSGIMVQRALDAAQELAKEGISAEVINVHTWNPLDTETILKSVAKTKAVVTCENHGVVGGLGGAIAELLAENNPVPLWRIGVRGRFGEVGNLDYLSKIMGLTVEDIVKAAKDVIARK